MKGKSWKREWKWQFSHSNIKEEVVFLGVRLSSVLRGNLIFSSSPQRPMTPDVEGFSIPDFIHYISFPILILEKEPVFPFWCWVPNKGTTGSTLPLGYRGGGKEEVKIFTFNIKEEVKVSIFQAQHVKFMITLKLHIINSTFG